VLTATGSWLFDFTAFGCVLFGDMTSSGDV
jgi:hypothetical protein